jgi:hypothetical protein
MTYFADLGTETMIVAGPRIRAVGWLEPDHEFSVGDTEVEFQRRLGEMSKNWSDSSSVCGWPVFAGPHRCGFCAKVQGFGEFAVPGKEVTYVAPSLIAHYVEAHQYAPPWDFIEAVMACPAFSSPEYGALVQDALAANNSFKGDARKARAP